MSDTHNENPTNSPNGDPDITGIPEALRQPSEILSAYEAAQQLAKLRKEAIQFIKPLVLDLLRKNGIARPSVHFDGYGDSGQIERVVAYTASGEERDPPADTIQFAWPETECVYAPAATAKGYREIVGRRVVCKVSNDPLPTAIEPICYELLWHTHASWENNDGAYGEFVFDAAAGSISLEFNERYTESTYYGHEW